MTLWINWESMNIMTTALILNMCVSFKSFPIFFELIGCSLSSRFVQHLIQTIWTSMCCYHCQCDFWGFHFSYLRFFLLNLQISWWILHSLFAYCWILFFAKDSLHFSYHQLITFKPWVMYKAKDESIKWLISVDEMSCIGPFSFEQPLTNLQSCSYHIVGVYLFLLFFCCHIAHPKYVSFSILPLYLQF